METHSVQVGAERRELPVVIVGEVSVALLNLLGDTQLVEAAADELVKKMPKDIDTLITPEVKAVPLSPRRQRAYRHPLRGSAEKLRNPTWSMRSVKPCCPSPQARPQELVIDGSNLDQIKGKRVAIIDGRGEYRRYPERPDRTAQRHWRRGGSDAGRFYRRGRTRRRDHAGAPAAFSERGRGLSRELNRWKVGESSSG